MEENKHPKLDYDKLIAESDGLYREWWLLWKRIHPEWGLVLEKEIEPPCSKVPPKIPSKQLSCKRCDRTWTPRRKEPPVQCPECKSPYWNRERKKV